MKKSRSFYQWPSAFIGHFSNLFLSEKNFDENFLYFHDAEISGGKFFDLFFSTNVLAKD